jgi:hypothetical protein
MPLRQVQLLNSVKNPISIILMLGKSRSFAKQTNMKRLSLIATLIVAVLLLQKCKTESVTATATSSNTLFAVINDTTWSADTINASVTYNAAAKTKVCTFTGTARDKQVQVSVTVNNGTSTQGFPIGTYGADAAGMNTFAYYTSSGNGVFVQQGTVIPGSGTITIASIDSVKRQMTGTFSLVAKKTIYDNSGNIISTTINEVAAGAFNNMPYTFTSK